MTTDVLAALLWVIRHLKDLKLAEDEWRWVNREGLAREMKGHHLN
jgi:hypothetical protein